MPITGFGSDELEALIAAGETYDVEFKSDRGGLSDDALAEAASCLANRMSNNPGWLLVGVEDDGEVTGARVGMLGIDSADYETKIRNRTVPALAVECIVVTIEEKPVVCIRVPASRQPVGTARGRYLQRREGGTGQPVCQPFYIHEMDARAGDWGNYDPSSAIVSSATFDDLDPAEFDRFRRLASDAGIARSLPQLSDQDLAKALSAVESDGENIQVNLTGMLLFGKEASLRRLVPQCQTVFQVLEGERVRINHSFNWPILRTFEAALEALVAQNTEEEFLQSGIRVAIQRFSEKAFREGLVNALVHRDYSVQGAVYVQMYRDRLVISSPGGFPAGVSIDNIVSIQPTPRNRGLVETVLRSGIAERVGRGVDVIFAESLRNGYEFPSYERSTPASVVLAISSGQPDLPFAVAIRELEREVGGAIDVEELLILQRIRTSRSVTVEEASLLIQLSQGETRGILGRLSTRGWIVSVGTGNNQMFGLSEHVSGLIGIPHPLTENTGNRQERMELIAAYAHREGRVTRSDVMELLGCGGPEATYLLSRLSDSGVLVMHGARRGAYYEPA